jgi:hypothetical protein
MNLKEYIIISICRPTAFNWENFVVRKLIGRLGSSVGIATGLRAGRSGDGIPVGARFFTHVQTDPEAHPSSCTVGTGSFPGVKRPGRGADHPPPSSAEVKKEYSYTSTQPLGQVRPVMGLLYLKKINWW